MAFSGCVATVFRISQNSKHARFLSVIPIHFESRWQKKKSLTVCVNWLWTISLSLHKTNIISPIVHTTDTNTLHWEKDNTLIGIWSAISFQSRRTKQVHTQIKKINSFDESFCKRHNRDGSSNSKNSTKNLSTDTHSCSRNVRSEFQRSSKFKHKVY